MWSPNFDDDDYLITSELEIANGLNDLNSEAEKCQKMLDLSNSGNGLVLSKLSIHAKEFNPLNPFFNIKKQKAGADKDDESSEKVNEEEEEIEEEIELLENLRSAGVHYNASTNLRNIQDRSILKEDTIYFHGVIPILAGSTFFKAKSSSSGNSSQIGYTDLDVEMEMEIEEQKVQPEISQKIVEKEMEEQKVQPEISEEIGPKNPFKTLIEAKKIQERKTRQPIACSFAKTNKTSKKKTFVPMDQSFDMSSGQESGYSSPTIGMPNHKYYTPRELYLNHRFNQ